jgi:hypothetical protein
VLLASKPTERSMQKQEVGRSIEEAGGLARCGKVRSSSPAHGSERCAVLIAHVTHRLRCCEALARWKATSYAIMSYYELLLLTASETRACFLLALDSGATMALPLAPPQQRTFCYAV